MPTFIGDVIKELNYEANFNYNIENLPNDVPKNDSNACSKYSIMIRDHIKAVMNCWFTDTGIETISGSNYGSYEHEPSAGYTHTSPRPLRTIALEELKVDSKIVADIDKVIRVHDRSRYSDDEFYAAANHFYGSNNAAAFNISQVKHTHRNAHEFAHYINYLESGSSTVSDMPVVFAWIKVASWLANYSDSNYKYNVNRGKNPFQYYWGRNSYYVYVYRNERWQLVWGGDPVLPTQISMSSNTKTRIEAIVDRWAQVPTHS